MLRAVSGRMARRGVDSSKLSLRISTALKQKDEQKSELNIPPLRGREAPLHYFVSEIDPDRSIHRNSYNKKFITKRSKYDSSQNNK